ncbi:ROK family protein [Pedobacter sp. UYP30]|uniref:ROK family protein n=1 Tax=Pedobacter sp. UYP30 TaxID=1756400 RepID=UPI0033974310
MSKSIPLVARLLSQLVDKGLLIEKGYAASSGGRKPLLYGVAPGQINIVAVAMDQLSTRIVIVDFFNNYLTEIEVVDLKLLNNPNSLDELSEAISAHILNSGISKNSILGIGIGMPGFVNAEKGVNYTYLDSGSDSITSRICRTLNLPVFIDNDSSLVAFAELKFGVAKQIKDVMVINLSWGIGLGMIINGHLFRGHSGFAGEFSHIPISEEGALCSCGKQGCLEAQASLLAVAEKAIEGIKSGRKTRLTYDPKSSKAVVGDALMEVANEGDQFAIELLSEAAYEIGRGLSILIHIINPRAIVLSGRGAKVGKLLLAPIQQALNKYCIPRLAEDTEIYISDIGFDAELIGAAILVMENAEKIEEPISAYTLT